ncbi:NADH:flavin oxidoreductase / NADH oxidase family protein [Burkholderia thailandensis MSMB121]|uniref:oxidoreductase n=1 Tax=Burkholderia humptydooensis TaxID=430531 RepID=UPI0003280CC9|nr:NADH:flavin oxidoreductase / NADH oxidase [Burkholderia humptydooensis]AGK49362.1 NADH:flavin oxidoreductase / NADH oxidase family protein [Burkholderia thailandensis MSMB121]ATF35373.1 oxidoreductase [Burkholderia thailandensis]KST72786.1 oxidoreductase [Burkholderia humptydooensis]
MSALFSSFTLRGVTLPNRIVISPMCQYSAENGEARAWHMIHLGQLALSGAGLLCIEATAVEPDGRISPADLGLWNDAAGLERIRRAFVESAKRAAFPDDRPVGVRVSATDWVAGGWELDDTIAFARELKRRGCDWVDVSSGGVSPLQNIPVSPGYQVPFAQAVKRAVELPTIAVGLISDPEHANRVIEAGDADFVAMARAMLYDPRWPWHAAAQLGATVSAPPQYWRSQPREHKALFGDVSFSQR